MILSAFSVELYLKCLLWIECEQYPASHDLKELFSQLKRETRHALRKQHDASPTRPGNLEDLLEKGGDTFNRVDTYSSTQTESNSR
jgi:HEPN domain-containing protein